jgi:hypothetical protein
MPKKTSDDALKIDHLTHGEAMPPLLSEKHIAQLQGAVEAAQRNRMLRPRFVMERHDESCPNL